MMKTILLCCFAAVFFGQVKASVEYRLERDLPYREVEGEDPDSVYLRQQCRLDVYAPVGAEGFATIIWFHGGGLTGGEKYIPTYLKEKGIGIVSVEYRLSPHAPLPAFLEDAAAATAWVFEHIASYGGDSTKIFISGHSAGAYLAAMVGMDARWLEPYGHSPMELAGVVPVSGQVSTHFTVKRLRGDSGPELRVVVDEYAPLTYASKDLPPICLIVGDRKIEYRNRVEENELLATSLRNLGHPNVEFHEMGGLDHNTVVDGASIILVGYVRKMVREAANSGT